MRRALPKIQPPPAVSFDPTLSIDLLALLNRRAPMLGESAAQTLASFLKGDLDAPDAKETLRKLLKDEPSMVARLEQASGDTTLDVGNMSASLFVWSLNQPWAGSIDFKRVLAKWTGYTITQGTGQEDHHIPRAFTYLNRLLPLVCEIPEDIRPYFITSMYNELTWLTSKNESHAQLGQLMGAMGALSSHCPNELSKYILALPEQWVLTTHAILEARNRPESEKLSLSVDIANGALPDELKARALLVSPGPAWAVPCVAAVLIPTLPDQEFERFSHLPWEYDLNSGDPIEANKALMTMYCPSIAPIVEMAASEDDWLDKDAIEILVEKFKPENVQAVEAFDLPEDMEPM